MHISEIGLCSGHSGSGVWVDERGETTVSGLYAAGDMACVPHNYLLGALTHGKLSAVRRVAIGALAYFVGPALLDDFVRAIGDSDWRVRAESAIVLGRTGLGEAIPALRAALGFVLAGPKRGDRVARSAHGARGGARASRFLGRHGRRFATGGGLRARPAERFRGMARRSACVLSEPS